MKKTDKRTDGLFSQHSHNAKAYVVRVLPFPNKSAYHDEHERRGRRASFGQREPRQALIYWESERTMVTYGPRSS